MRGDFGTARLALAAAGLAFVGAFVGTLTSPSASLAPHPTAGAHVPLLAETQLPQSLSQPSVVPRIASSEPVSHERGPPAATGKPATAASAVPSVRSRQHPNAPAGKRAKPIQIGERYGI